MPSAPLRPSGFTRSSARGTWKISRRPNLRSSARQGVARDRCTNMCGLVGIVGHEPVNQGLYDALTVLQHRGQDAAGIMTDDAGRLRVRKGNGLVRDVFLERHMLKLAGNVGLGHVRYPTAGSASLSEAQPFYVNSPYGICLAHNGNLVNADELKRLVTQQDHRHLNTNSDSEVLLNVFAHELSTPSGNGL